MKTKRWILAVFVLFVVVASSAEAAGPFSRTRDAAEALFSRAKSPRCWVVFPPTATDGGDLEVPCLALAGSDPTKPASLVRFQITDAAAVGKEIKVGSLLTLKRSSLETGGLLPVYLVEAKRARGWKSTWVPRFSETIGHWGYLVAGRMLASDPDELDRFFETRPGLRALLEADVSKIQRAVFPGLSFSPSAKSEVAEEEPGELRMCRASLEQTKAEHRLTLGVLEARSQEIRACQAALLQGEAIFEDLANNPELAHHRDLINQATDGVAGIRDFLTRGINGGARP